MPELKIMPASKRYGYHPAYIGMLLRMGELEGRKDEYGHWLIKTASIEAHRKRTKRRVSKQEGVTVGATA